MKNLTESYRYSRILLENWNSSNNRVTKYQLMHVPKNQNRKYVGLTVETRFKTYTLLLGYLIMI